MGLRLDRSHWTALRNAKNARVDGDRQSLLALKAARMLREHSGEAIGVRLGSIPG